MRRLLAIAVLLAGVALPSPVAAQRWGGRVSIARAPMGRVFIPAHPAPVSFWRAQPSPIAPMPAPSGAWHGGSTHIVVAPRFNFFPSPFFFGPQFFTPIGWFDTGSGEFVDNGYEQPAQEQVEPVAVPVQAESDQLAGAVQRLSDEVEQLRYERANPSAASAAAPVPGPAEKPLATDLVFRDGHKIEVQNYAVMGQTVYVFEGEATHRIPLADLNLAATKKANTDRGVDFIPSNSL